MGKKGLKLNPDKIEWLWMFGLPESGVILYLAVIGVSLPMSELVHNLRVFLDL